jgi:putative ABC transport system permease protein
LVGGEVALAVIVVVCAVLLINTFVNILSVDPGFRGDRVLAATVELPSRYKGMAGVTQFFDQVIERLAGVPGVERASASQATPIIGGGTIRPVLAEGRPEPQPGQERTAHMGSVTPGYLESMSIPLLSGRTIARSDTADTQPVAMIGETLAAREFGGENPLGRKIRLGARDWYQVIGVVKDIHYYRVTEPVESEAYVAFSQAPSRAMSVVVRTAGDPSSAAAAIRAAVRAVDPNQAVSKVETISTLMEEINAPQRILTQISSFFGALALFLAAIGIYGVMAYAVAERTQEIGVRMALGAQRGDVLRLIFRQSAGMLGGGMIVGLAAAFALARVMHNFLFGVRPTDPVTFLSAAVILAAVAALACWIPARRAAGVDPVIALRHE